MNDKQEPTPNYTPEMVKILRDHADEHGSINLESAKVIGERVGKSWQSIVAKCGTEKIPYTKKVAPPKRVLPITKGELVIRISAKLNRVGMLDGLEKSTAKALKALENGIDHLIPEEVSVLPSLPTSD